MRPWLKLFLLVLTIVLFGCGIDPVEGPPQEIGGPVPQVTPTPTPTLPPPLTEEECRKQVLPAILALKFTMGVLNGALRGIRGFRGKLEEFSDRLEDMRIRPTSVEEIRELYADYVRVRTSLLERIEPARGLGLNPGNVQGESGIYFGRYLCVASQAENPAAECGFTPDPTLRPSAYLARARQVLPAAIARQDRWVETLERWIADSQAVVDRDYEICPMLRPPPYEVLD